MFVKELRVTKLYILLSWRGKLQSSLSLYIHTPVLRLSYFPMTMTCVFPSPFIFILIDNKLETCEVRYNIWICDSRHNASGAIFFTVLRSTCVLLQAEASSPRSYLFLYLTTFTLLFSIYKRRLLRQKTGGACLYMPQNGYWPASFEAILWVTTQHSSF